MFALYLASAFASAEGGFIAGLLVGAIAGVGIAVLRSKISAQK